MKRSGDTIGNRTHNHPNRSAVPQPTAPPHAPYLESTSAISFKIQKFIKIKVGELQTTNCAE
jgi:hypothetical protein